MGIALPKGTDSDLASWAIPSILGFLAGELGERGLPRLNSLARKAWLCANHESWASAAMSASASAWTREEGPPLTACAD